MAVDDHIAFFGVKTLGARCRAAVAAVDDARSARNEMIRDAIKNGAMSRAQAARTAGLSRMAVTNIMRGHNGER